MVRWVNVSPAHGMRYVSLRVVRGFSLFKDAESQNRLSALLSASLCFYWGWHRLN